MKLSDLLGAPKPVKKRKRRSKPKPKHAKTRLGKIWSNETFKVVVGDLVPRPGRPRRVGPLFTAVGEKLPFAALPDVRRRLREEGIVGKGIYMAHDSMGVVRYVGRGDIFTRLNTRWRKEKLALLYFSFYVVAEDTHEREIETLLIRAVGPTLHFNQRKKRVDIESGNVRDYEAGTLYFERQYARGGRLTGSRKSR